MLRRDTHSWTSTYSKNRLSVENLFYRCPFISFHINNWIWFSYVRGILARKATFSLLYAGVALDESQKETEIGRIDENSQHAQILLKWKLIILVYILSVFIGAIPMHMMNLPRSPLWCVSFLYFLLIFPHSLKTISVQFESIVDDCCLWMRRSKKLKEIYNFFASILRSIGSTSPRITFINSCILSSIRTAVVIISFSLSIELLDLICLRCLLSR